MNVYPGYYKMFSSIPDLYALNTPVATPRALLFCGLLAQSCPALCDSMGPTRLLCPWDSPGKNTGVGCLGLLQGIFPIQKSMSPALAGGFFTTSTAWEAHVVKCYYALILEGKPVSDLPICGACSL